MTSSAPPLFLRCRATPKVAQIAAVSSLVALIVLCVAWELWLAPVRPGGSLLALKALPLVLPLAGLLKRRMYTLPLAQFDDLALLHRRPGARHQRYRPQQLLRLGRVVLCILLFTACTLHIRLRLKAAKTMQQQA